MLEIGNGGMSDTEYQSHMSLWAILAAPLLAGNDLRSMSPLTMAILTNREVIAVDQDKDGRQGKQAWKSGDQEIWVRELAGGERAVAMFNRGADSASFIVKWQDLGMKPPAHIRDLWGHKDESFEGPEHSVTVPSHGVVLWRVR
jgi:alpha-galactosidase